MVVVIPSHVSTGDRRHIIRDELHDNVGDSLDKALGGLEDENASLDGVLSHIDFYRRVGNARVLDSKVRDLIRHFSKDRLRTEDSRNDQVLRTQGDLAQQHFNVEALNGLLVAHRKKEEQTRISEMMHALGNRIPAEGQYGKKLHLVKKGVAEDLLTGRLCVMNDTENEHCQD